MALLRTIVTLVAAASAMPAPQISPSLSTRAVCEGNTASDRSVWCDYSIDTNWYDEAPDTGITVEYWFEVQNITAAPDGFERIVLAVNGTVPGPLIEANWGDTVKIHVTNALTTNGTGIHWHGIRQNYTNQEDGVPSITQCPIAPGESYTYTWKAIQYGTSWYHSHYSLQAWNGVFGPMVIHGPATANYDAELEPIVLSDWSHQTSDELYSYSETVGPPELQNGLINGLNTFGDGGSRYQTSFESGKSYRIRIVNTAIDTHYKFAIDGHSFQVIAMDFVPIVPYTTTYLDIGMGQRYDIVVNADQETADYWMRAVPQSSCSSNSNGADIRAIVRYSASSTADPTSTADANLSNADCNDELLSNLVPYLSQTVVDPRQDEDLSVSVGFVGNLFKWQIGLSTMLVEWANPSLMQINEGNATFENQENVYKLDNANEWVYFVIETQLAVPHPIHLHGHDFFVLAAEEDATYDDSVVLNLNNPPRRDVANLPSAGFLVIAFLTDNPGAWLMHCHIGWHTSQGLALQFVERESEIPGLLTSASVLQDTCAAWNEWADAVGIEEEDSGV
ncbi:multicopper oxidase [Karstenula rhodostoma CBS 690.94]|uniref:laccase n=1 Tax=Karstenula rhodostoma CBS 690.94 TaxID=1392251 RepID=A0A9P4PI49_9PLEO|nr:multicopper oxidase [Karstenula rhodostoma CBS 690.94]